jgi:hypothetical protein
MHSSGWRFCRKGIKYAEIFLIFVFACIPSFHCRINVLITFGILLYIMVELALLICVKMKLEFGTEFKQEG